MTKEEVLQLRESFSPDRMRLDVPLENPVANPVTNPVTNGSNVDRNRGYNLSEKQKIVLSYCAEARSSREILSYLGVTYQSKNLKQYVSDLVEFGFLMPTIPDNPSHPGQKYITKVSLHEVSGIS